MSPEELSGGGGLIVLVTKNHVFHKKIKRHPTYGRVCDTHDFRGQNINVQEGVREKMVCSTEYIHEGGREYLVCSTAVHENRNL